jgi:hypothetical protein
MKSGRISGIQSRADIRYRYPASGLAGYQAGRISGQISILCIPTKYYKLNESLRHALHVVDLVKATKRKNGGQGEGCVN